MSLVKTWTEVVRAVKRLEHEIAHSGDYIHGAMTRLDMAMEAHRKVLGLPKPRRKKPRKKR